MYQNLVSNHRAVIFGGYVRLCYLIECPKYHELWFPYEAQTTTFDTSQSVTLRARAANFRKDML